MKKVPKIKIKDLQDENRTNTTKFLYLSSNEWKEMSIIPNEDEQKEILSIQREDPAYFQACVIRFVARRRYLRKQFSTDFMEWLNQLSKLYQCRKSSTSLHAYYYPENEETKGMWRPGWYQAYRVIEHNESIPGMIHVSWLPRSAGTNHLEESFHIYSLESHMDERVVYALQEMESSACRKRFYSI